MVSGPLPRPVLLPGLARLWRDRHTLQLGLDPSRAILLELANPRVVRLLDLLDGAHSERTVLDRAPDLDVSAGDARSLLDTLRAAGLLVPAQSLLPAGLPESARGRLTGEAVALALGGVPTTPARVLRRRADSRVVVSGPGRLAAPVAVLIAQAGVGQIDLDLPGRVESAETVGGSLLVADVGRPRTEAVADAVARAAPGTRTGQPRRAPAALVVLAGADRPAPLLAAGHAQRRQPHLMLDVRDGVPVIGPFVPAAGSPCLNCLDLHRRDRDPDWPELSAQLVRVPRPEPCAAATLVAATGYAAAEILSHLDGGRPETLGGSVEVDAPGRIRRRAWPPHPACGCGPTAPIGAPRGGRPRQGGREPRESVTMIW